MPAGKQRKPKRPKFNYDLGFKQLDMRAHPELYRIGIGEQGVLSVEPYKSELLPHWRFATPDVARESSEKLYAKFEQYKAQEDAVGCDCARKFIQMGLTRARRYANRKGGRKYAKRGSDEDEDAADGERRRRALPKDAQEDPVKAESARIFGEVLERVKKDKVYASLLERHRKLEDSVSDEELAKKAEQLIGSKSDDSTAR